ncbi:sodium:solute symporter family protein [Sinomicrobium soli]|uniref:sodium:solute symporter family transporter n=1 Tax=Sinomicrobium sp. N-1-3-6 TaxID=2219864 RepID=UPI000DCEED97|nr:sodium/solute symporter [Sinomicrobium sp. N-1-3-6]RAV29540.1 sodium transporter [Sinomicrobium sp. N-1-3-6]
MISPYHRTLIPFLFLVLYTTVLTAQQNVKWELWDTLPGNPGLTGQGTDRQPGLAGSYSGVSNGTLLIAGGANFPGKMPWKGGEKKWWDQIYVCELQPDGHRQWKDTVYRLPSGMGYGAAVVQNNRLLCIGGDNSNGIVPEVIALEWDPVTQNMQITPLKDLPEGFKAVAGDVCQGSVLVHGIRNNKNVLLELGEDGTWATLPGCPGPPRNYPAAATQSNGKTDSFFLFGGRTQGPEQTAILYDGYRYDPVLKTWSLLGNITTGSGKPHSVMAAPAVKKGSATILVFGGDDGKDFLERESLERRIRRATDSIHRKALKKSLGSVFEQHRGFSKDILAYNTITDTWTIAGTFPGDMPVTTNIAALNGSFLIPGGEIHPGVRTRNIWKGSMAPHGKTFGWLNYTVIILYFAVMILIGVRYSKRQRSTDDYFKGGGRIPWWAAGLSLFGTSLSAITFMAVPAKTYAEDWTYFFFQMTPLLTAPVIVFLFIPFYRRLNITTAYEYLEKRFNLATRLMGSLSFILLQLGRVGIVLLLPALAINLVTGINIELCILSMGTVSVIYTMMGGIEAVIWTDVLQVVVLLGGAILSIVVIALQLDLGMAQEIEIAREYDKLRILDWALDFREPTIWVVVLGGIFSNLIASGTDQTMVQRYLTTSGEKEASQSAWTFALMAIPATLVFFSIGTLLFLFYRENPGDMNISLPNNDAIFPWYIVTQLPAGISGLLIAGVLSAAMSSLSSSMNSVSTAFITDFYFRMKKRNTGRTLSAARWATLVFGILGIAFALLMASWNIKSLWDQFQLFIGWFAGGLGALFLLGIVTRKANGPGAVSGLVLSAVIQYLLTIFTHMHPLLFAATGFVSCFVLSYLCSLAIPGYQKDITGLNIHSIRKNRDYNEN